MNKKFLIVDIKTSGQGRTDQIIEFGAVLFEWTTGHPLYSMSENIIMKGEIDPEITLKTGIEDFMLKAPYAVPIKKTLFFFSKIAQVANYYVAHNADNVFEFITAAAVDNNISIPEVPIIDTRHDLPYPAAQTTYKLNYLLADHGLYSPFANRSVFDAVSIFSLMKQYKWKDIKDLNESEDVTIRASAGYQMKERARELGFEWDAPQKKWLMTMKRLRFERMKRWDAFPFPTTIEFEIPF